jgi:ferredoxin
MVPSTPIASPLGMPIRLQTVGFSMNNAGFEEALTSRVDAMVDACTKCGKCFEVCPIAGPAGLGDADPKAVVSDYLSSGRRNTQLYPRSGWSPPPLGTETRCAEYFFG